jgi:hypothetical protein
MRQKPSVFFFQSWRYVYADYFILYDSSPASGAAGFAALAVEIAVVVVSVKEQCPQVYVCNENRNQG